MSRNVIFLVFVLSLCMGCAHKKAKQHRPKNSVYLMYYQRAVNSLNNYSVSRDSMQLIAVRHYLDSAAVDPALRKKIVIPRVSLFLLTKKFQEGCNYANSLDSLQFQRPYQKKMYVNFFQAFLLNQKQEYTQRDKSLKTAIDAISVYLKTHPKDTVAISDLFSIKMYCEQEPQLVKEMESFKKQHPEDQSFVEELERSFKSIYHKKQ